MAVTTRAGHTGANPRIGSYFAIFTSALCGLVLLLVIFEQLGVRQLWLSHALILLPIAFYLAIAVATRTVHADEFFTIGRRLPGVYGGLTLSASVFGGVGYLSLTGSLFLAGYDALALGLGLAAGALTGGALIMPYVRRSGASTLPGYLGLRFDSGLVRLVAAVAVLAPVFLLLCAELKLAAFVTQLFISLSPTSALVLCAAVIAIPAMLGGLRALTWSQCAQAITALLGLLVPLAIISVIVTNLPVPQITAGELMERMATLELTSGIGSIAPGTFHGLLPGVAPLPLMKPFLQPFGLMTQTDFLMLSVIVALGVAALPSLHLRAGAATSIFEQRTTVGWGVAFLAVLLITVPAFAAFARYETLQDLVGTSISQLPGWMGGLRDAGLAAIRDTDGNGMLGGNEFAVSRDGITLALPIMFNLPFVLATCVAVGAIAAALAAGAAHAAALATTAGEDLLTAFGNARATAARRLLAARIGAGAAALLAALLLTVVSIDPLTCALWALTLLAGGLFPVLLLATWWRRCSVWGALAGLAAGFGVTALMIVTGGIPDAAAALTAGDLFAGLLGAVCGFGATVVVSLVTPRPSKEAATRIDELRNPGGEPLARRAARLSAATE